MQDLDRLGFYPRRATSCSTHFITPAPRDHPGDRTDRQRQDHHALFGPPDARHRRRSTSSPSRTPSRWSARTSTRSAVQPKIGVTFATALRTILRQDPDIIMVGEIRDQRDGAERGPGRADRPPGLLDAAHQRRGHLRSTRLIDLGIEPFLICSTLIGAMAQRLVRKICADCKRKRPLTVEEAAMRIFRHRRESGSSSRKVPAAIAAGNTGYSASRHLRDPAGRQCHP